MPQACCGTMQVRQRAAGGEGEMPAVPITVRQLEAIVRISESLARMQLQVDVTEAHVQQAMDLFKTSTMDAVRAGATEGLVSTFVNANELLGCLCPAVALMVFSARHCCKQIWLVICLDAWGHRAL